MKKPESKAGVKKIVAGAIKKYAKADDKKDVRVDKAIVKKAMKGAKR